MTRDKCSYSPCQNMVTEDKPPFTLSIENSIRGYNFPTRFNSGDMKFCSEECMRNELDARRGENDDFYYTLMKYIKEKGLYDP